MFGAVPLSASILAAERYAGIFPLRPTVKTVLAPSSAALLRQHSRGGIWFRRLPTEAPLRGGCYGTRHRTGQHSPCTTLTSTAAPILAQASSRTADFLENLSAWTLRLTAGGGGSDGITGGMTSLSGLNCRRVVSGETTLNQEKPATLNKEATAKASE